MTNFRETRGNLLEQHLWFVLYVERPITSYNLTQEPETQVARKKALVSFRLKHMCSVSLRKFKH